MNLGTSIFYTFHEQSMPYKIAGIYSSSGKTEEEMIKRLKEVLGSTADFNERDNIVFIEHTKIYANKLLGNEIDPEVKRTLRNYFPESLDDDFAGADSFMFQYYDSKAVDFVWSNKYHTKMKQHLRELISASVIERKGRA